MYIFAVFSAEEKRQDLSYILHYGRGYFNRGFNLSFDFQRDGADRSTADIRRVHTFDNNKFKEGQS